MRRTRLKRATGRIKRVAMGTRQKTDPEPRNSWELEPDQGHDLQRNIDAECNLVRRCGIVSLVRSPLLQDQADRILQEECATEVEDVECAIGSASELLGKILGYNGVAENSTGADG